VPIEMAALINGGVMIGPFETIPWMDDLAGGTGRGEPGQAGADFLGGIIKQP
jgi:hypothetical protein